MSGAADPPTLRAWLQSRGGAAPVRAFMEDALYHPAYGYYTSRIRDVGARGDFSTSATLGTALARAIAEWILRHRSPGPLRLIELGPGNGRLHRDVLRALGWRARRGLGSFLVDRSPILRARQRRTLWRWRRRVTWRDTPGEALRDCGGTALIFSNELIDAFPATLLQRDEGAWREVWLETTEAGGIAEALRPWEARADTSLCAFPAQEGQRAEAHESACKWLGEWAPLWKSGAMLTIDYGDTLPALLRRRPGGTLRGYAGHRRLEGAAVYQPPGSADLTADVNFTDLQRWGEAEGLITERLETQREFLLRHLPETSLRGADARLADPMGAGGAFLCLTQLRGKHPG